MKRHQQTARTGDAPIPKDSKRQVIAQEYLRNTKTSIDELIKLKINSENRLKCRIKRGQRIRLRLHEIPSTPTLDTVPENGIVRNNTRLHGKCKHKTNSNTAEQNSKHAMISLQHAIWRCIILPLDKQSTSPPQKAQHQQNPPTGIDIRQNRRKHEDECCRTCSRQSNIFNQSTYPVHKVPPVICITPCYLQPVAKFGKSRTDLSRSYSAEDDRIRPESPENSSR